MVVSPLLNNFEPFSVSVSAITPSPSDIVSPCLSDIEVLLNQACDDQDHNELPPGLPPKRNGKRPSIVIHSDSDDSSSEEKMSQFCKRDGPGDQKRVKMKIIVLVPQKPFIVMKSCQSLVREVLVN